MLLVPWEYPLDCCQLAIAQFGHVYGLLETGGFLVISY